MHDRPAVSHNVEIAIAGCTEREFSVYREWLQRSFGDRVLPVLSRLRPDGGIALPVNAAIVIADLDRIGETAALRLRDGRRLIGIADQAGSGPALSNDIHVVTKPLSRTRFKAALEPVLRAVRDTDGKPEAKSPALRFDLIFGASAAMKTVLAQARRVARSTAPVFIKGEAGTGVSTCARIVHENSDRTEAGFAPVDCASLSAEAIIRDVFGRRGLLEQMDGGTLFLKNVDALDGALQVRLLRFVQSGLIVKEDDTAPLSVDVRLVCSSSKDMTDSVKAGLFRDDLFYHLFVLPLEIPALRDRPDDIAVLARRLMDEANRIEGRSFRLIAREAELALTAHDWPGNMRELATVIRRIVALNDGTEITAAMLPGSIAIPSGNEGVPQSLQDHPASPEDAGRIAASLRELEQTCEGIAPLWMQEQRIIETALVACDGHVGKAAEILQISPSTIYRKMQAWTERDGSGHPT